MNTTQIEKSLLEQLGLRPNEAKIYLAVLALGEGSAAEIARKAAIERTSSYPILEELSKKELIQKSIKGTWVRFSAREPEALLDLLKKKEGAITQLLPMLRSISNSASSRPKIRFFDSIEGIQNILTASLSAKEKVRRDFAYVVDVLDSLGSRFLNKHIEERVKKGIEARSLRSADDKQLEESREWYLKGSNADVLREVRYLPRQFEFHGLVMIYDHNVAIIGSSQEPFAVVIQSADFSSAMKALFDFSWDMAAK